MSLLEIFLQPFYRCLSVYKLIAYHVREHSIRVVMIALTIQVSLVSAETVKSPDTSFDWETIEAFRKVGGTGVISAFSVSSGITSTENFLSLSIDQTSTPIAKFLIGNYSDQEEVNY